MDILYDMLYLKCKLMGILGKLRWIIVLFYVFYLEMYCKDANLEVMS